MSFGFSVGDFIAIGVLAKNMYEQCTRAGDDYKELAILCRNFELAVAACPVNGPFSIRQHQNAAAVEVLTKACNTTLERLSALLGKYSSFKGAKGVVLRIRFVSAADERQSIREALRDHLIALQAVRQGHQIDLENLMVRLILKQVADQQKAGSRTLDLSAIPNDDSLIQNCLLEFAPDSSVVKEELEEKTEEIKSKLRQYEETKKVPALSNEEVSHVTKGMKPLAPVAMNNKFYDPWQNTWFAVGGCFHLWPVSREYASFVHCPFPLQPEIRYAKEDEWLCMFPEGWSVNIDVAERGFRGMGPEAAFYYVFNNLSCAADSIPQTSRLYFATQAFKTINSQFTPNATSPEWVYLLLITCAQAEFFRRFIWTVPQIPVPSLNSQAVSVPYLFPQQGPLFQSFFNNFPVPPVPPYQLTLGVPCTG